jgi:hypothetical protein
MENFDAMGVHTGKSIVIAPTQTLSDEEHQHLRDVALRTVRHLGIVGECNIQYAVDPRSFDYRVIEINARLSRSSALASKATGYPIAYVAAKLALGYALPELTNAVTGSTTALFEPALDYVVCKMPRWDLEKFRGASVRIGSEMKSVGEVMAIGRTFGEALQKAIRMLDIGADGLDPEAHEFEDLADALRNPTPLRAFAVARALEAGMSAERVSELSGIDGWFLGEIENVLAVRKSLLADGALEPALLRRAKHAGCGDRSPLDPAGEAPRGGRGHRHRGDPPWPGRPRDQHPARVRRDRPPRRLPDPPRGRGCPRPSRHRHAARAHARRGDARAREGTPEAPRLGRGRHEASAS